MADLEWSGDISSWVRELLAQSRTAWEAAASRDFGALAAAIGERDRLIKAFKSFDTKSMAPEARRELREVLEAARKMDSEIRKALMHEMEEDSRAIRDTAQRARALMAYDRTLTKVPRFDNQK